MELYDLYCKFPRISTDSRQVVAGGIFFALHGETFDGNRYAAAAVGAGAAAAVIDDPAVTDGMSGGGKGELFRRTRYAESIAGTGRTPPPATGDSDPRDYGQQRKNDDQRTDQPDAETEIPRSGHAGKFQQPHRSAADAAGDGPFGGIRRRGDGCESLRRDRAAVLDRTTRFRTDHQHRQSAPGRFRRHRRGYARQRGTARLPTDARRNGVLFQRKRMPRADDRGTKRIAGGSLLYGGDDGSRKGKLPDGTERRDGNPDASGRGLQHRQRGGGHRGGRPFRSPGTADRSGYRKLRTGQQPVATESGSAQHADYGRLQRQPSSMRAALANFAKEPSEQPKAVVLGDMGELGKYAEAEHAGIVELLQQLGIGEVYLVGKLFSEAGRGIYPAFADAAALNEYLQEHPIHGRLILVKGSRTMKLESVAERL